MYKIQQNCILPSSTFSVPKGRIKYYIESPERLPQAGDVIYGEICHLGFHQTIESVSARIHTVHDRTKAVFVFGNRYAPDQFEGFVPEQPVDTADLLARSGIIGIMKHHNERVSLPSKVRILGYACDSERNIINTRDYVLIKPGKREHKPAAKLILCIGTAMNSGKSHAAAACCYALTSLGKKVRAAKITGTASLKDILLMQDCGAQHIADFSYFGHPSTYMLDLETLLSIFNKVDAKYGNNARNYLVVELADGILQRETAMLLAQPAIQARIHKLVFCAADAAGVAGGIHILKESFGLIPDAISGLCSSSPLAIREVGSLTSIPILRSMERDYKAIYQLIK